MRNSLSERIDRCAEMSWTSQPVEARHLAHELAREAATRDKRKQSARALHVLAWSCQLNGEMPRSFEYASLARRIWLSLGNAAEAARSATIASQSLGFMGLNDDALALALTALAVAERHGDPEILFLARNAQATSLLHAQEQHAALDILRDLAARAPSPRYAAMALNNIAHGHLDLARTEEAVPHCEAAVAAGLAGLEAAEEAGFVWLQRCVPNNIAQALAGLGRFDEAERLVEDAAALPGEIGLSLELTIDMSRADIAFQRGDCERSAELLEDISYAAVEARDIATAVQASEMLAACYAALGRYRDAYAAHREFHRHHVAMAGEEAQQRARVAEIGLETDRLRAEAKQLADDAMRDPLTGLANRRKVDAVRERMEGAPFAVVLFDIDHFKRVNDRFSHAIGDRVLGEIALLAEAALADGELVARIGGEEFVLLLPALGLDMAAALAERLRSSIASHDWDAIADGLAVTASFGVATSDGSDRTSAALVDADRRLYAAKDAGRNCVVAADKPVTLQATA